MQALHEAFPHLKACHYLDTATVGLSAPGIGAAAAHFLDEVKSQGIGGMAQWQAEAATLRTRLSRLLAAPEHACEFFGNTSEGIHLFARALKWSIGDKVVCADDEFPTLRHAWDHCGSLGVEVQRISITDESQREELLIAAIQPGVKVLAVSQVHWITGTALDLKRLGRACRANGTLFLVDGTQAIGAVHTVLDVVDAYSAAGFKWLAGPFGIGFFLMTPAVRANLSPTVLGAWNHQQEEGDADLRYGHMNYSGIYALSAALAHLENFGWADVYERTRELRARVHDGLMHRGIRPLAPEDRSAGITSFNVKNARAFHRYASERQVQFGLKGEVLRISPHFYNGHADVDALLSLIASWQST